jgi:hypothetical protein
LFLSQKTITLQMWARLWDLAERCWLIQAGTDPQILPFWGQRLIVIFWKVYTPIVRKYMIAFFK